MGIAPIFIALLDQIKKGLMSYAFMLESLLDNIEPLYSYVGVEGTDTIGYECRILLKNKISKLKPLVSEHVNLMSSFTNTEGFVRDQEVLGKVLQSISVMKSEFFHFYELSVKAVEEDSGDELKKPLCDFNTIFRDYQSLLGSYLSCGAVIDLFKQ